MVYGNTTKPSLTSTRVGFDQLLGYPGIALLVADDFQLDPVGEPDFAPQPRGTNGSSACGNRGGGGGGGGNSRGVRQDKEFFLRSIKIEQ